MRKLLEAHQFAHINIHRNDEPYILPSALADDVEGLWLDLVAQSAAAGRTIWNGPIYRLAEDNIDQTLKLGFTDFKTYFTTGFINSKIATLPFADRPNGMFVSGYLETSDSHLIFGKKSSTSIIPFDINFIGGTLSPDEDDIQAMNDFKSAIAREIYEETSLDDSHIEAIKLLEIWETNKHRIGVVLHALLKLDHDEFFEVSIPNDEHDHFVSFDHGEMEALIGNSESKINPLIAVTLPALE